MSKIRARKACPVFGLWKRSDYATKGGALREGGPEQSAECMGSFRQNDCDNSASASGSEKPAGSTMTKAVWALAGMGIPDELYFTKSMSLNA